MSEPSLLRQRRFAPFFGTLSLGAFNDNVYKQALIILITYTGLTLFGLETAALVNLAAVIFILPFFLFSATAGQLADRYPKDLLIRRIKFCEILIMLLATAGFYLGEPLVLLGILFLMGTQSAFFGPIKYSLLPQILAPHELVKGNGLVSMATFVSILLGSLCGGILIAVSDWSFAGQAIQGWMMVAAMVITMAVIGYWVARQIPAATPAAPDLDIDHNIVRQTLRNMGYVRENIVVFRAILGVSWFWFFGSVMLAQLPPLIKEALSGNETVATLVFTLFSVGVGVGSLLCDKLSDRRVEIGLVPLGSIGLTLFAADIFFSSRALEPVMGLVGVGEFLARDGSWRFVADVLLIGIFGGLYIVPLSALIQQRSKPEHRSRVIAGGNILNALFMVLAGIYSIGLLSAGLSVAQLILVTAVLNAVVALYIFLLVPEFLLRFAAWVLVHTIYRLKVNDLENIPDEGPALLVCNHVSFIDALVVGGSITRPVRFVMYHKIFNMPIAKWLFKTAKTIPIAPAKEDPALLERAFERIAEELDAGEVVCIFPEGAITHDGQLQEFRSGVERILARNPVPVVPMALKGLWGSFFSRSDGGAFRGPMRKFLARIELNIGAAIPPDEVTAASLQEVVSGLMVNGPEPIAL